MSTLRLRRLAADYDRLREFVERHPRLKLLSAAGDPPEQYQIEYKIRSLRQIDDELKFVAQHTVEITLPRDYPRMPPQCRMLTPVFHPNIAPHAICVGDHWSAGEPIGSIVARIGEMLAYQSYNTKSPLNGEAARWVEQHLEELPLDKVNMLGSEATERETPAAPTRDAIAARRPAALAAERPSEKVANHEPRQQPVAQSSAFAFGCPECGERLKASAELVGKRARCKKCLQIITIPESPEQHC
jgi:ubiquitin-protein ligase